MNSLISKILFIFLSPIEHFIYKLYSGYFFFTGDTGYEKANKLQFIIYSKLFKKYEYHENSIYATMYFVMVFIVPLFFLCGFMQYHKIHYLILVLVSGMIGGFFDYLHLKKFHITLYDIKELINSCPIKIKIGNHYFNDLYDDSNGRFLAKYHHKGNKYLFHSNNDNLYIKDSAIRYKRESFLIGTVLCSGILSLFTFIIYFVILLILKCVY